MSNELMKLAEAWVEADAMWENAAHRGTTDEQRGAEEKANAAKTAFATALSAQAAELEQWRRLATDPAAVRVNLLRGTLAKPDDLIFMHDSDGPYAQQAARLADAERRVATMREALELFARHAKYIATDGRDDDFVGDSDQVCVTYGDLRRAAAAIRTPEAARVGETPEGGG